MIFSKIQQFLFNIGLAVEVSFQEKLRRELLNQFIAVGFLMVFAHLLIGILFIKQQSDFLTTLLWFILLLIGHLLNVTHRHFGARIFLVFVGSTAVFILHLIFGPQVKLEPMYVLFIVLSMFFFNLKYKLRAMGYISLLAIVASVATLFYNAPYADLVSPLGPFSRFVFVVSMVIILTGNLFKKSYEYNKLIQEQNQQLLDANNQLKSLNYIFAHDLKEPVRAIVSYSQLLNMSAKQNKPIDKEHLDFVINSGLQLNTLLDDIKTLQLAQTETLENEELEISGLVSDVEEHLSKLISERNAVVNIESDISFKSSKLAWFLICKNLIENAFKYNKSNNPRCTINARLQDDILYVSFEDNGYGIEKEFHEEVFNLFKRLNADKNRGSGLGLNIVRNLVEKLGGQIKIASSEIGKGSKFLITLPQSMTYS